VGKDGRGSGDSMGKLKFDMQKARAEKRVTEIYDHLYPAALERIAELEACLIENKKRWAAWMATTDQVIIDKLRDQLCESEAISLHNFQRYQAAIDESHIVGFDHRIGWSDLPEDRRKAIVEVHREMLKCEGKI
jgi:hypothetical protein